MNYDMWIIINLSKLAIVNSILLATHMLIEDEFDLQDIVLNQRKFSQHVREKTLVANYKLQVWN